MSGLELQGVVKRFAEVTVVQQLDLQVGSGEFVVLLGESGCGKSTTLRMIAGLESVSEGRILLAGQDMTHKPPMQRDMAMVFQNYALYPHMDVARNMSFALRLAGRPQSEIDTKVAAAAKVLNIEHLLARKPKELSGGQRQRVAIGRAIVREPQVFLFDEPLSNLDAKLRGHMRAELALLHQRLGKTTVYVTHDQTEAMTLASRIAIFDKGRIQQLGTPSQVFNHPSNLFVAAFIGTPTMNLLPAQLDTVNGAPRLRGADFDSPAPSWLPGAASRALMLGLRPQVLRAQGSAESGSNVSGAPVLRLQVEVVEYLGTESQVSGRIEGAAAGPSRLVAMVPGDARDCLGSTLSLGFDPEAVHLFDPGSGHALRPTHQ